MVSMQVVKNNCLIFPGTAADAPGRADLRRAQQEREAGISWPLRGVWQVNAVSHQVSVFPGGRGEGGAGGAWGPGPEGAEVVPQQPLDHAPCHWSSQAPLALVGSRLTPVLSSEPGKWGCVSCPERAPAHPCSETMCPVASGPPGFQVLPRPSVGSRGHSSTACPGRRDRRMGWRS